MFGHQPSFGWGGGPFVFMLTNGDAARSAQKGPMAGLRSLIEAVLRGAGPTLSSSFPGGTHFHSPRQSDEGYIWTAAALVSGQKSNAEDRGPCVIGRPGSRRHLAG